MAATARLTATRNISSVGSPRAMPAANTTAHTTSAAAAMRRPSRASRRWSGVCSMAWDWSMVAIWPSSVSMPVATTTPRPRPDVAAVPLKAMLCRSATMGASSPSSTSLVFTAGSDSPVSAASLTRSAWTSTRRTSAETTSPAPSMTRSPGTMSGVGTSRTSPPRTTLVDPVVSCLSAAIACSARYSWTKPTTPFSTTMIEITTVSVKSPTTTVTTAARARTTVMVLRNWRTKMRPGPGCSCSTNALGPWSTSR